MAKHQIDLFSRPIASVPDLLEPKIMPVAEILAQIERVRGRFPRAAVEAAVARREEITPDLLNLLERTYENASTIDDDYSAHLYAMFLLAQFREPRAYPLLLKFCLLDGDILDCLFGDVITEDLARIIASVCGGDVSGIQSIIENPDAYEWVRGALLDVLTTLVGEGQRSREAVVDYLAELFRGKLEREHSEVWHSLIAASCDIYPAELIVDIKQAYRHGLVDPSNISMDDVRDDLALGKRQILARLAHEPHHRMVRDTIKEMEWWACFQSDWTDDVEPVHPALMSARVVPISAPPKIGRNEACSCGSGKKYKKCCGQ